MNEMHQPPRRTLRLWRWQSLLSTCAVVIALSVLWLWRPVAWVHPWALVLAGFAVIGAIADQVWILPRRWRNYRYVADDSGFLLQTGSLVRRRLVVPTEQILFVDTRQGPIAKALDLQLVRVGTLGSTHDVGPLDSDDADRLVLKLGKRIVDA